MEFLVQIARIIDKTVKASEFVYGTAEDTDGLIEPDVKQVNLIPYLL